MPKRKAKAPPRRKAKAPPRKGRLPYAPTHHDRQMVRVMVAGGIEHERIRECLEVRCSEPTFRKAFRPELTTGKASADAQVIAASYRLAAGAPAQYDAAGRKVRAEVLPDQRANKWWTQARMGWREHIVVDDGKPADTPMRVQIEFVGEASAAVEHAIPRDGTRLSAEARKRVQLVG